MDVDLLMVTYNRPEYTRLALSRLLNSCDGRVRVWIWHNGEDAETLDTVMRVRGHRCVREVYHSKENRMLREPTNWFWRHAEGALLGKVDDDCLVPEGWIDILRDAHKEVARFGIVSCWPFLPEDFVPGIAERKIGEFNGHRLLQNFWVGGSGYLMKRSMMEALGPLGPRESFSGYCMRGAANGWVNGWYFPLLYMEHMEDPRSPHCTLRSEEAFAARPSLSSRRFGTQSLAAMRERAKSAALEVQEASIARSEYFGWRASLLRIKRRMMGKGRVARFNA